MLWNELLAGKLARRAMPHRSTGWRHGAILLIAMLGTACIVLPASEASAQCTARDALRNHLTLNKIPSANIPPITIGSAATVPVWKTITVGKFANSFALIDALDAAGCSIGGSAGEILARPAFTLGATMLPSSICRFVKPAMSAKCQIQTLSARRGACQPTQSGCSETSVKLSAAVAAASTCLPLLLPSASRGA